MKRILFVDDERNVLDGIRRMMHGDRGHWEMKYAVGGEEALRAFDGGDGFDVIVSDMLMPGVNGVELLQTVRERYPNTARLILSGYAENALAAKAATVAHQLVSKPCVASDLRAVIERVCTLQDVLRTPELRAVVSKIDKLPSLSETYIALTRVLENPSVCIRKVARIIESDIAMSAKILQLVNGAFFGPAQKVTQIEPAIEYLGLDTIRNLALTSEVFTVFKPDRRFPSALFTEMQAHSRWSAAIVNTFDLQRNDRDVAAVSSLLHDIGHLILAAKMPDCFSQIQERVAREHCRTFEAEEQLLGVSHAEIGAYLLGLWGIDDHVVEAIAHHHHPTRFVHAKLDPTVAVYLADLLTHEIEEHPGDPNGQQLIEAERAELRTLGVMDRYASLRENAERYCEQLT
jgi:HD-like signal output (HDOD) protein/CheY-like chemotaxis protein